MDQLIVTKWKDRSLTALLSDGHCRSLTLESGDESLLGNIYIGKTVFKLCLFLCIFQITKSNGKICHIPSTTHDVYGFCLVKNIDNILLDAFI